MERLNVSISHLGDAATAGPLKGDGPIGRFERLELLGFERGPSSLIWLAKVRRSNQKIVLIPTEAAIRRGLTTRKVYDKLIASIGVGKIEEEIERMERQANLDMARHSSEVLHNVAGWVKLTWWIPYVGVPLGITLAAIEEISPGAVADIAEGVLDAICRAPLSAVPAWAVGACEGRRPWWVPWAVGGGLALGGLVLFKYVRDVIPIHLRTKEI